MKKYVLFSISTLMLAACRPSENYVATAVAQTLVAQSTISTATVSKEAVSATGDGFLLTPTPINLWESIRATDLVTSTEANRKYQFNLPYNGTGYPHWVFYVRSDLESKFDPQTIYDSKITIHTTLNPLLQEIAEQIVKDQVEALADRRVSNGALVAIRPSTGEILAMVGSADFYNEEIVGQINMAISPRQPGSSIQPLVYAAAFEKGWTPSTLIWDVPSEFPPSGDPDDTRPPYEPVNYDGRFHGPVTVRTALANSYNVPAVKALDHIGVYDDPQTLEPDGLVSFAERLGITTLTHDYYGLSLAIGGGEFSLLELTSAYATFANGGVHVPPYAITHVVDNEGNILYEYQPPPGNQVIRAEHAYLITSILSDNEARTPAFGPNSLLNLPFPVAAKTGTIDDFRDNWTFGYTPDLAVGVWLGNTDNTPMRNISGLTGAAPIWNQFMQIAIQLLSNGETISFFMPPGVVEREICSASGTEPSEWCPLQRLEIFAIDQLPLPSSGDLWRNVLIDTWTGLFASPACDDFVEEKLVVNASDPWAVRWLQETSEGQAWAEGMGFASPVFILPTRGCSVSDPRPLLSFTSPYEGQTIRESPLQIVGVVDATAGFRRFRLEYGLGRDPLQWEIISERETPVTHSEVIYTWELSDMPSGELTLRLYMESTFGTYAEKRLHINIQP